MRHAVHVHEISKRVFVFPRYKSIEKLLASSTSFSKLQAKDFVEIEFRGDRLAAYPCVIHTLGRFHVGVDDSRVYRTGGALSRDAQALRRQGQAGASSLQEIKAPGRSCKGEGDREGVQLQQRHAPTLG